MKKHQSHIKKITKKVYNNIIIQSIYNKKWILYVSILKIEKHLILVDYYSIFQLK